MPSRLYKILIILGIAIVLAAMPAFWLTFQAASDLEINFLDVGQGDAILIKSPYGQNILIDGGPDDSIIKQLSKNLAWWDRTIDLMVLTHPHDDHVNGLNYVIERYKVKKILYSGVSHSSPGYINWLELIRDYNIPLMIIDRPQTINLGQDCRLDILYPTESFLGVAANNLNNTSIVAKLIFGENAFLLTGDAEIEVEQILLDNYSQKDLSSRVLKAGHHGSNTSSSQKFLEAVNPGIAFISVGADNKFGHPSLRTIKRLERLDAKIYRADTNGSLKIISNGKDYSVLPEFEY